MKKYSINCCKITIMMIWWLIVYVNLTGLRYVQMVAKYFFLIVCVRCTWKKVVDSIDLANEDPKWVDTIQCFDGLKRIKRGESANLLSLLQLWHPSPHANGLGLDRALCIGPQIPRPLNSDWIALLTPGSPIGRQHTSWDFWFPQSHEPSPILNLIPPPPPSI